MRKKILTCAILTLIMYAGSETAISNFIKNNSENASLTAVIKSGTDNEGGTKGSMTTRNTKFKAGTLAADNDNNQTVVLTVTAAQTTNYNAKTIDVTITVQKYTNGLTWTSATPSTVTYADTSKSATATAATNGGTNGAISISNNRTDLATASRENNTVSVLGVKAGTATITISAAQGTNYLAVTPVTLTVTVIDIDPPEALTTATSYVGDGVSLRISSSDNDTGISEITMNGTPISITKDGNFATGTLPITTKGTYEIVATDNSGNSTRLTIYAYQVSYNANRTEEVSGNMTSHLKINDVPLTIKDNGFTKVGHTFAEWNTKPGGTNDGGTGFAEGASYIGNADVTLYAQWDSNTYTATFYNDDGVNGLQIVESKEYKYGEKILVPDCSGRFGEPVEEGDEITGYTIYMQDAWAAVKKNPSATHDVGTEVRQREDGIYVIPIREIES